MKNVYTCINLKTKHNIITEKHVYIKKDFYKFIPNNVCGVYILYFNNGEKYVGSSGILKRRISQHFFKYGNYIIKGIIYLCKCRKDYLLLEKFYIQKFHPKMNNLIGCHSKDICIELLNK